MALLANSSQHIILVATLTRGERLVGSGYPEDFVTAVGWNLLKILKSEDIPKPGRQKNT